MIAWGWLVAAALVSGVVGLGLGVLLNGAALDAANDRITAMELSVALLRDRADKIAAHQRERQAE